MLLFSCLFVMLSLSASSHLPYPQPGHVIRCADNYDPAGAVECTADPSSHAGHPYCHFIKTPTLVKSSCMRSAQINLINCTSTCTPRPMARIPSVTLCCCLSDYCNAEKNLVPDN